MREYDFLPCTRKDLLEVIKWAKNALSLTDWKIVLHTEKSPPALIADTNSGKFGTSGQSSIEPAREFGVVWIPIERCRTLNDNAVETLIHEMCHVKFAEEGISEEEYLVRLFSPLLYELYCREKGIEIAPRS